jgi:hypothetical protein
MRTEDKLMMAYGKIGLLLMALFAVVLGYQIVLRILAVRP